MIGKYSPYKSAQASNFAHIQPTHILFFEKGLTIAHSFIPNREGQDLQASFSLLHDEMSPSSPSKGKRRPANGELHFQRSKCSNCCLRNSSNYFQPRRPTEHFQNYSALSYSIPPYLNRRHHLCPLTHRGAVRSNLMRFTKCLAREHHPQMSRRQLYRPPASRPLHRTRTSFLTYHQDIT